MKLFVFNRDERVEIARSQIQTAYSKYYSGWNNQFDREYDNQTMWFILDDGGDAYGGIGRFVFWNLDNVERKPLSINLANESTWKCYTNIKIQAEGTGLTYSNQEIFLHWYRRFSWLDHKGVEMCYSIFNRLIRVV
jgi:hypothetical protein